MNDSAVSLTPSSEASSRIYRLILNVYVVGALCLVGISGNLVSIVVLGRDRSIRRTTGLLLRALAVTDTVYLVSCLFIQTAKTICDSTDWVHPTVCRALPYLEPYMWPLASIAQTGNVWMLVVITADRYVAICRPLHAAQYRYCTKVQMLRYDMTLKIIYPSSDIDENNFEYGRSNMHAVSFVKIMHNFCHTISFCRAVYCLSSLSLKSN